MRKTPLVIEGTQTQVLADSIAIAARVVNHCATYPLINLQSIVFFIQRVEHLGTPFFYNFTYILEVLIKLIFDCRFLKLPAKVTQNF